MDRVIDHFIVDNQSSRSISFNNLKPTADGFRRLCDFMRSKADLAEIQMEACNLRGDQIEMIADVCAAQHNLETLSLEWNPIRDSVGLHRLLVFLQDQNTISNLSLRECELPPSAAEPIANFIQNSKSLSHLDLGHNELSLSGCELILDALAKNFKITQLHLLGNGATPQILTRLETLLERNRKALRLDEGLDEDLPQVAALKLRITEMIGERNRMEEELTALRTAHEELIASNTETTLELEEAKKSLLVLEATKERAIASEAEAAALRVELAQLRAAHEQRGVSLSEARHKIELLEDEGRQAEVRFEGKEKELRQVKQRLHERSLQAEDLQAKLDHTRADCQRAENRAGQLELDLDSAREAQRVTKAQNHAKETQLSNQLHAAEEESRRAVDEARETKDLLARKRQLFEQQVSELQQQLEDAVANGKRASADHAAAALLAQRHEEELRGVRQAWEAEGRDFHAREAKLEDKCSRLDSRVKDLETALRTAKDQSRLHEEAANRASIERDKLANQLQHADGMLHESKQEVQRLKREINARAREAFDAEERARRREEASRAKLLGAFHQVKAAFEDALIEYDGVGGLAAAGHSLNVSSGSNKVKFAPPVPGAPVRDSSNAPSASSKVPTPPGQERGSLLVPQQGGGNAHLVPLGGRSSMASSDGGYLQVPEKSYLSGGSSMRSSGKGRRAHHAVSSSSVQEESMLGGGMTEDLYDSSYISDSQYE